MILSVASGKGGTGKTTVATNLAALLKEAQFIDCDVEGPNAHIFLKPSITSSSEVSIKIPEIIEERCTHCGRCADFCSFNALAVTKNGVMLFEELCRGCGGCSLVCPEGAVEERNRVLGVVEEGIFERGRFLHGKLTPGEPFASPIIRELKRRIDRNADPVIIDSPPGVACPMINSVSESDFVLLVTEPTPFGLFDLSLAVSVLRELEIPMGVVINKADEGRVIEDFCKKEGIPVLLKIPFSRDIAELYSRGELLVKEERWKERFEALLKSIWSLV
ncbi:MAG: ATP-binding protein [Archaeoglobi archaeon]|nr:ATP-binding protein [Candidatus Mnemosynella bozhongmuii]